MVHVSQFKRRIGLDVQLNNRLLAVNPDGKIFIRPRRALNFRQVKKGGRMRWEVLLEWEDLPKEETTWEHLGAMN